MLFNDMSNIAVRIVNRYKSYVGYSFLLLIGVCGGVYRFVQITYGKETLTWDAQNWWIPVAEAVFSGTPLYIGSALDNKPPLFEILNLIIFSTGHYELVFLILMGVANGLVAILLASYIQNKHTIQTSLLAGLLYLSALPAMNGLEINVRQFGIIGVLLAMHFSTPTFRGIALATGGLFTQYIILTIPAFLYDQYKAEHTSTRTQFLKFITAGLTTVTLAYMIVGLIWGGKSVFYGFVNSYAIAPYYVLNVESQRLMTTGGKMFSPLVAPMFYLSEVADVIIRLLYILIPASVFIVREISQQRNWSDEVFLIAITVLLLLPILIRGFKTNWVYSVAFLSTMSAIVISERI